MENKRKPKGYWTFDNCQQEAIKHKSKQEFQRASYQAYDVSRVKGWLELICSHMTPVKKPSGYWSLERCVEESLKYELRSDFQEKSQTAYVKAVKNGWLDIVCSHMIKIKKPKGYWNLKNCREEALKYDNVKDFAKNSSTAYKTCGENKWLEDVCSHMELRNIWNFEKCREESLKFNSLYNFRKYSNSCYLSICRNGWLELLCSHMVRLQNKDNYLTKEICRAEALRYETRKEFREDCSKIYNFICKNNWLEELCNHQKCEKTNGFWTKDMCHEKALECKTNTEFKNKYPSAYASSLRNKWLCDIRGHFEVQGNLHKRFIYAYEFPDNHVYVGLTCNIEKRKKNHLIKGAVFNYCAESNLEPIFIQISLLPIEVEEAKKQEGYYLNKYISNGWIPLNKAKVGAIGNAKIKWTMEKLQEEALKYTTKKEFRKYSESAYSTAKRYKIINDICKHMNYKESKGSNYWTYENCKNEALKYNNKKDFYTLSSSAYGASIRNNWLENIYKEVGY